MKPLLRFPGSILLAAGLGLAAAARGQLISSSPFLPAGASATGGNAGPAGPVELRGIMTTPEGTLFCIYDTVKKTSNWVGLNEQGRSFLVKSYDSANDSVTVSVQGHTDRVTLHTSKVASAGSSIGPSVGAGQPNPLLQSVVVNPTPADEAKRLEAVAAEVQRRRRLREQAMQGNSPGSGPPPSNPGGSAPGMRPH